MLEESFKFVFRFDSITINFLIIQFEINLFKRRKGFWGFGEQYVMKSYQLLAEVRGEGDGRPA